MNHVWMPFATGGFAVVAPNGKIVAEGLTKEQAEDKIRSVERATPCYLGFRILSDCPNQCRGQCGFKP